MPSNQVIETGLVKSPPWQTLGQRPFLFGHSLAKNPLFEVSQLAQIAESVARRGSKYAVHSASEDLKHLPQKEQLVESIRRIDQGTAWLKMSSLNELDRRYEDVTQNFIAEVENLTNLPLRREITWSALTVFIASPHMVTPYHFDHDVNFLFQVHGEKDVWLYDQDDRFVLTEDEIEAFYRGNPTAGIYRDELGDKGTRYHLSPGIAVHQPPLAPHLIRNGSSVSVSVSIYFALRSLDIRARIYQANACLRQLGMHPLSPGLSPARDWLKSATVQMISKRKPSSQSELLFSGMRRISASLRLANRVVGRSSH